MTGGRVSNTQEAVDLIRAGRDLSPDQASQLYRDAFRTATEDGTAALIVALVEEASLLRQRIALPRAVSWTGQLTVFTPADTATIGLIAVHDRTHVELRLDRGGAVLLKDELTSRLTKIAAAAAHDGAAS